MKILLKLIYRFNAILMKTPTGLAAEMDELILKSQRSTKDSE